MTAVPRILQIREAPGFKQQSLARKKEVLRRDTEKASGRKPHRIRI